METKDRAEHVARRSLLYEVSRSFGELIDLDELLALVISKTKELLQAESSAVLLLDETRRELYFPYIADVDRDAEMRLTSIRFPADRGIAGWVVQHGEGQVVPDVTQDPRWYPDVDKKSGQQTRSLLCVPLRTRHGTLGVVSLRNKVEGTFTPDDLDFLNALSGSIAIAIENASLYRKLRESEAQLRQEVILLNREMAERKKAEAALQREAEISAALARVGKELISSLDAPALLEQLCRLAGTVLNCERSHTFIWQARDAAYASAAHCGLNAEQLEVARLLHFDRASIAPLLSRLGDEDVVDVASVYGEAPPPALHWLGDGRHLCLALRGGMRIAGLQFTTAAQSPPGETQLRIARGFAQLASMALANAKLVAELDRANQLKSDFVATMSHELRTPLHVMMGYNDLLLGDQFGPLSPRQREMLQKMAKNAKSLMALVNATMDLSRLEAGRLPTELGLVNLAALIGEIRTETEALQVKPDVRFEWTVPDSLPRLTTDGTKLKVILKNLLDNAVKFTAHGSVSLEAQALDGGVAFDVKDTGTGIHPEVRPFIFESFRQGEPALTRRFGGVGIGLYIVRRLLDVIGGTICVESEVGVGSKFRVWLPLTPQIQP